MIGRLLELIRLPGLVRPFRHYDGETGLLVSLRTSRNYTTLTVGRRDFYFIRESGKYDGFGESQSEPREAVATSSDYTADCAEG